MHLILLMLLASLAAGQPYDLVVTGGRVLDPETGLDAIRHVGIRNGRIAAVSVNPLMGKARIDGQGLVVAPGFIDLHAHGQDLENQRYQAADGVTTALELEIGTGDVEQWYYSRAGKRLIHSGVTAGHVPVRMRIMRDPNRGFVPSGDAARRAASDEEITLMKAGVEKGLQEGALGVGFGIQYTPAASRWEIQEMFRVAARFRVPAFVHIRHMGPAEPDAVNAVEEVIANAAITGAPLHIVHITSSGLAQTPKLMQMVREARQRGLDVTTECYPYNAAMTELQSAMFDPGWQKVLGIDYDRVEWVATGERLTARSFQTYRRQGGMVIMHMIPDAVVDHAVAEPSVMIASDGVLSSGKGHPRGAGSFSRTLGLYVRQKKSISLMAAVTKMSLLPANRLGLNSKGRIRVGADADLTIFNPDTVIDRATFSQPNLLSEGIRHVIVAGVAVLTDGKLRDNVFPGQPIRRSR
jgi:dihydroorotase